LRTTRETGSHTAASAGFTFDRYGRVWTLFVSTRRKATKNHFFRSLRLAPIVVSTTTFDAIFPENHAADHREIVVFTTTGAAG
jgi:hypothetical protein